MGDPRAADTWMGALISSAHMAKVKGYIQRALEAGATVLCGEGKDKPVGQPPEGLPKVHIHYLMG